MILDHVRDTHRFDSRDLIDAMGTETLDRHDEADIRELLGRLALASDGEPREGILLIAGTHFEEYAREVAGVLANEIWPLCFIDWGQAAAELQQGFVRVLVDGLDYWVQ